MYTNRLTRGVNLIFLQLFKQHVIDGSCINCSYIILKDYLCEKLYGIGYGVLNKNRKQVFCSYLIDFAPLLVKELY